MPTRHPRMFLPLLVAAGLTAALSACAGSAADGASSSPTASPTSSSTPVVTLTPTPTPTPTETAAAIPTSCAELGTASVRAAAVGDLTLQSDGVGFVRPAPTSAVLALGCDWIVGDATGMLLLISTAPPADVTAAIPGLADEGYACSVSDDFGAQYCQKPGPNPDTEEMIVARDDVWVYMSTSNRNGRAFLSDIASQIWG